MFSITITNNVKLDTTDFACFFCTWINYPGKWNSKTHKSNLQDLPEL